MSSTALLSLLSLTISFLPTAVEAPTLATTTMRHSALDVRIAGASELSDHARKFRERSPLMQRFNVNTRDLRPGTRDVQIEGELDLAVAGQLDEALTIAVEECTQVLVGLERCSFIDSSGIAVILRAHNRMQEEGNQLVVYAPVDQVLRVLSMTGLTTNSLVFNSVEDALAALGDA